MNFRGNCKRGKCSLMLTIVGIILLSTACTPPRKTTISPLIDHHVPSVPVTISNFSITGTTLPPAHVHSPTTSAVTFTLLGDTPITWDSVTFTTGTVFSDLGTGSCHAGLVMNPGDVCTVNVNYDPIAAGTDTDELLVHYDSLNVTQLVTVPISGTTDAVGIPHHLLFTTQPSATGNTDTALARQPVVTVYDVFNNVATFASSGITLTAHDDAGCTHAAIAGGITATNNPKTPTTGVATFAGTKVLKTNAIAIMASDGTLSVCSDPIAIDPGAASTNTSVFSVYPTSVIADGVTPIHVSLTLKDANNNVIPNLSIDLDSSRGAIETVTTSPSLSDASGVVSFTVVSSSTGNPMLSTAGGIVYTRQVYFLNQTPIVDFQARYAKSGKSQGNSSVTSAWKDLATVFTNLINDFLLFNFATPNTAWVGSGGSGMPTDPYRLTFTGASSRYMVSTEALNAGSSLYLESWLRPSNVSETGKVIVSNADLAGKGMMIRQSRVAAGKLEATLGIQDLFGELVLDDSPVAYWRLGEQAGAVAKNLGSCLGTASDCDGTYNNTPTLSVVHSGDNWGDSDSAISLDGSSSESMTYTKNNLTGAAPTEESFEFWVNPSDLSVDQGIYQDAAGASDPTPNRYIEIASTGKVRVNPCNAGFSAYTTTALQVGTWYHLVWTRTGTSNKIYVNGVQEVDTSITASCPLTKGWIGNGTANYFTGKIDEFAIYDHALAPSSIQDHYTSRSAAVCHAKTALTNGSWAFVASNYDSVTGIFKLYINGLVECSVTLSNPANLYAGSTTPLTFAAQLDPTDQPYAGTFWSGDLAELRGSNTSASDADVIDHYSIQMMQYP